MSAERRRREDHLPSDEWPTDPQGLPSGGRPGEAWSAGFHHEPGPRASGHDDWPGDREVDQDWASSYRFDGRPSDEPWRDPSQRGDSSPADQAWHHDVPPDDEDDWVARTQADQSWRYRSLADDHLSQDQPGVGWPGTDPAAEAGRHAGEAAGRRASDSWPASTRADETWRESRHGGAGRAGDSYAVDPRATDPLAADGRLADPLAADPYPNDYGTGDYDTGDYASGRPSGTHVVGGRRASDSWLAGPDADESLPAVDGRARDRLTGGDQPSRRRGDGGRAGRGAADGPRLGGGGRDGRDGSDWDEGGRPGGRRRILVSVMAAVAVILAFGAYGLIRAHNDSSLALQDASSRPCAAKAGRCHSHLPRTPGPASTSPVLSDSGMPSPSGSATSGAPSTAPSHPPTSMAASVPAPTHSAAPPPKPTPRPSASASQPTGSASSAAAAQVLTVINQARAQQGLPALAISSGLNASSAAHTSVMAGDCGLSHKCPGEPPLGTRLTDAGVQWTSAGENIGDGGPVASSTAAITQMAVNLTQSMLHERRPDDGHRMNILSSSFHFIGTTVFVDAKGIVWMTQDFSS
ncbi:MAG TPA: CAP domain-containing protein [Streptosporangiaceae bacterium]|nr:CAP domain-containing protein [Streptosporangiaceae bacterium]